MIDIESEIFTIISENLKNKYSKIFVVGEYVRVPPEFPCVSIIEEDNEIYRKTRTSCEIENHAQIFYEINIYSNKKIGKKSECKEILKEVDKLFNKLGFTRTLAKPIPNVNDATIYRMVARYRALVSKDKVIYRR